MRDAAESAELNETASLPQNPSVLSPTKYPRLVILGIDGLDPEILQEAIERFPAETKNFQALAAQGQGIKDLGTSCPPQSPVAWSNFITGMNPGGHGIFDFIHRNKVSRGIKASIMNDEPGEDLHLWGTSYKMPWGGSSEPNRTGTPFWALLGEEGIPADVWRMPINYPVTAGKGLSFPGMMTPAVDSAYGEATLYTSDAANAQGDGRRKQVANRDGRILTQIEGPNNSFQDAFVEKVKDSGDLVREPKMATVPLTIYVDEENNAAAVMVDGGETIVLEAGQWSDFTTITYSMLPMGASDMNGIVRFYLRSVSPHFEMYMSPVNMDPMAPAAVISEPQDASANLAGEIGLYYTQGMAEDVGAYKKGMLSTEEFISQVELVYQERNRMLDVALDRYTANEEGGLLFFYYSTVDLGSHMMWRHTDDEHPDHNADFAAESSEKWTGREGSTWKDSVMDLILRMDPQLGEIRARVGDDTAIMVMSDHGFAPFRRKFDLNSWLVDEGYLVLKSGYSKELPLGSDGFSDVTLSGALGADENGEPILDADGKTSSPVDWTKSRAYGVGFNGLYLNLKGREGGEYHGEIFDGGIVEKGAEAEALLKELKAKLEALVDPKDGGKPILRCDIATEVYSGPRTKEAPDIQVGYNSGYGNSDEAAQGRITSDWLTDNLGGTFNGSHLMSPDVVAGILITNQKVKTESQALADLTATILDFYGLAKTPGMVGQNIFE
ncbi:MAG: putative AlkP superfamily phosphohydrolase/phosphomutase [Planctomycetota bacterium]